MRLASGNTTLRSTNSNVEKLLLQVRNQETGLGSYTAVAFNDLGTTFYDEGFDTQRLSTAVSLYSHITNSNHQLGIQTREKFDRNIEIDLGFSSQIEGQREYSISLSSIEGQNIENENLYLYDKLLDIETNISDTSYNFTASNLTFNNRFTVRFKQGNILSAEDNLLPRNIFIHPNPATDEVIIRSKEVDIRKVKIFDLQGRKIKEFNFKSSFNQSINIASLKNAIYFIELISPGGNVVKKLIKK